MKETWTLKNNFFLYLCHWEGVETNPFALEISVTREFDTKEATRRNVRILLKMYEQSNQVSTLKYLLAIANTDGKHILIFLLCISSNKHIELYSQWNWRYLLSKHSSRWRIFKQAFEWQIYKETLLQDNFFCTSVWQNYCCINLKDCAIYIWWWFWFSPGHKILSHIFQCVLHL